MRTSYWICPRWSPGRLQRPPPPSGDDTDLGPECGLSGLRYDLYLLFLFLDDMWKNCFGGPDVGKVGMWAHLGQWCLIQPFQDFGCHLSRTIHYRYTEEKCQAPIALWRFQVHGQCQYLK